MSPADSVVGFYGKLPALGDFVTRRLPRDFVSAWDDWLQQAIMSSREDLGDTWLQNYLVSPIWRFALMPGMCGANGWAGVVIPSVDRVGRYFPLTIAASVDENKNPFNILHYYSEWYDHAESVILGALHDDQCTIDDFDLQVEELKNQLPEDEGFLSANGAVGYGIAWRLPILDCQDIVKTYPFLMHQLMQARLGAYSLWWTNGSEQVSPSLLLCAGMAPVRGYTALLNGRWDESGWEDWYRTDTQMGEIA